MKSEFVIPVAIHIRDHDHARVRIWTPAMAEIGAFEVVDKPDVDAFLRLNSKMTLFPVQVHHCGSRKECECPFMEFGEVLDSYL